MKRRNVILGGGALVALAAAAGAGGVAMRRASQPEMSLEPTLARLHKLKATPLQSKGAWSPFHAFSHMAQSVEYSMDGYPQAKPAWFQATLGKAAFNTFAAAGAMRHNLAEPIPGATPIADDGDVNAAIDRLIAALRRFDSYGEPLKPHFAYGLLSKADYTAAHVLHIENHLTQIS